MKIERDEYRIVKEWLELQELKKARYTGESG
jgi:hypothetical protein